MSEHRPENRPEARQGQGDPLRQPRDRQQQHLEETLARREAEQPSVDHEHRESSRQDHRQPGFGHQPGPGEGDRPESRSPQWGQGDGRSQASVTALLRDLAHDAAEITRKEVALARNEVAHAVSELKTGLISMASGGGILFAGILFLLLSATLGLATVMANWLAALIVGGVVTLIGLILVVTGNQKLKAEQFRPDRTVEAMRKDRELMDRRH